MKRKREFIDDTWISATSIRNYLLNDPCIDWLEKYSYKLNLDNKKNNIYSFSNYIMKKGREFEEELVTKLKEKFKDDFVLSCQKGEIDDKIQDTINLMELGIPIIYQGTVFNPENKTYGKPDLIVRSDYLNELTNSSSSHIFSLCEKWYYVIVEIKFSTLTLKSNTNFLLNKPNIKTYKGQLYIYNEALSHMQNYNPQTSYIIGRGWKSSKEKINDPFDKLAEINFKTEDKFIINDVKDSLTWLNDLNNNGDEWDILNPNRKELYPNMCNQDEDWNDIKKYISDKIGEITSLWQCGVINREISHNNNIFNWRDDNCNSTTLGITGKVYPNVVDKILNINRQDILKYSIDKNITPFLFSSFFDREKRKEEKILFVDFETVSNIDGKTNDGLIFLAGVGHFVDDIWIFKKFIVDRLNVPEENKMMTEFINYLKEISNGEEIYLYHYSNAEPSFFNKSIERNNIKFDLNYKWVDLLKIIKQSNFVVKGAFNFSLKSIVNALVNLKEIDISKSYSGLEVVNGMQAMIATFLCDDECENTNQKLEDFDIIKSVINYNEIDCLSLSEVLRVIEKNDLFINF